jgi:asparagine synthase (glutamine-hydrolysing)
MQSITSEDTIFKNVKALAPGAVKCWTMGDSSSEFICTGPEFSLRNSNDYAESSELLRDLLSQEVSSMLSADVPVCLVTSGGLDSSLISVLGAYKQPGIKAFNIAYKGSWPDDERKFAIELAQRNEIDLEVIEVDPSSFIEIIPEMVTHLGQPNAAPHALSTYLLFKTIKERGFKVAVTGEGADEQFGGYQRFATALSNGSTNWLAQYLDKLSALPYVLREELYHEDYKHFLTNKASGYEKIVEKIKNIPKSNKLDHLLHFDLFERFPYYILRRVDHLSMAHAIEVRVPFCQPRVTQFAAHLPSDWKIKHQQVKRILYKASETLLPSSILNRPKQPFTLPIQAMLQPPHPLFYFFSETLLNGQLTKLRILKQKAVEKLIDDLMQTSDLVKSKALWTLGIFEIWYELNQDSTIQNKHVLK